jgi:hypothetical protein
MIGLVEVLQCPRCGRLVNRENPEVFVGAVSCGTGSKGAGDARHRGGCGAHWWATKLQAGSVREQLLEDYDGDSALVAHLMVHFGLPESIDRPMFWEIELTGNQLYRYNKDPSPGILGRSTQLLKGVLRLAPASAVAL